MSSGSRPGRLAARVQLIPQRLPLVGQRVLGAGGQQGLLGVEGGLPVDRGRQDPGHGRVVGVEGGQLGQGDDHQRGGKRPQGRSLGPPPTPGRSRSGHAASIGIRRGALSDLATQAIRRWARAAETRRGRRRLAQTLAAFSRPGTRLGRPASMASTPMRATVGLSIMARRW